MTDPAHRYYPNDSSVTSRVRADGTVEFYKAGRMISYVKRDTAGNFLHERADNNGRISAAYRHSGTGRYISTRDVENTINFWRLFLPGRKKRGQWNFYPNTNQTAPQGAAPITQPTTRARRKVQKLAITGIIFSTLSLLLSGTFWGAATAFIGALVGVSALFQYEPRRHLAWWLNLFPLGVGGFYVLVMIPALIVRHLTGNM